MRELTRSMIRFTWAMPLLGVNQVASLVTPENRRRPLDGPTETFDALAEVAVGQMSPGLRNLYDQGEQIQRRVVDAFFGVFGETVGATFESTLSAVPWRRRGGSSCCGDRS